MTFSDDIMRPLPASTARIMQRNRDSIRPDNGMPHMPAMPIRSNWHPAPWHKAITAGTR